MRSTRYTLSVARARALCLVVMLGVGLRGVAQGDPRPVTGRWGLGTALTFCTAHIGPNFEQLDLETPGYTFSMHFRPTLGRTYRLAYGSNFKRTERTLVEVPSSYFGGAPRTTTLEYSWWYHEVQADLVLRPLNWVRDAAGPYFTCGITWRAYASQNRYPELTADELSDHFPEGDPELVEPWDLYWVFRAGAGYDRSIGPLVAFLEVDGQASCIPSLDGEGFTFGWGSAVGLRYVFRPRNTSASAVTK